ncbi:MAG: prolyl-tRNA editing protein [Gaiellaceae bacterium]|nr:MAG: prolyl-tRNA editing protein [Gaiellaceae bacterium]
MQTAWPASVERVSSFLRDAGAEARLEEFPEGTESAADAAEAVGCALGQIVKSLVFLCDERPVLALVPGDRRGDPVKIARVVGATRARVAPPDVVERVTGFAPGAVAPFALERIEAVLMDETLLVQPLVWVGAGSARHMVGLSPGELRRLSRARPVDVVQDPPYDSPRRKER